MGLDKQLFIFASKTDIMMYLRNIFLLFVSNWIVAQSINLRDKGGFLKLNQINLSSTDVFEFCDTDYDGFLEINLEVIKNQILSENISQLGSSEGVYISTSKGEILLVSDLNTNPQITWQCNYSNNSLLDIAIDESSQYFIATGNKVVHLDDVNCQVQQVYNYSTPGSIMALSFDRHQNLYLGGFDSKVYRALAGSYNQIAPWHDFTEGYAAGDFVMKGDKMYVAWQKTNECFLYEVTVSSDNDFISYVNLGVIPNGTFGLASELGELYGVTPDRLYKINVSDMSFVDIIYNTSSVNGAWYGAAGKNEAVTFNVEVFETYSDAQNNNNPLPNQWVNTVSEGQTVYVSLINNLNGSVLILPVDVVINIPPVYSLPNSGINHCSNEQNAHLFNLDQIKDQITSEADVAIKFYKTNEDLINDLNELGNQLSIDSNQETIFVSLINLDTGCKTSFSFDLTVYNQPVCGVEVLSYCVEDSNLFQKEIDLDNISNMILGNQNEQEVNVSYFLSIEDAENNSNSIENDNLIVSNVSSVNLFVRLDNNNSSCYSICPFSIYFIQNEFADLVYETDIEEWSGSQNTILITLPDDEGYVFSLDGIHYQEAPFFEGLHPGTYELYVQNRKECKYFITSFYILNYPSFFTPNGDGYNDFWKINFSEFEPDMEIFIYDRYGKLLKQLAPNSEGWDGSYLGNPMPSADYWFTINRKREKSIKGHFSLKR